MKMLKVILRASFRSSDDTSVTKTSLASSCKRDIKMQAVLIILSVSLRSTVVIPLFRVGLSARTLSFVFVSTDPLLQLR